MMRLRPLLIPWFGLALCLAATARAQDAAAPTPTTQRTDQRSKQGTARAAGDGSAADTELERLRKRARERFEMGVSFYREGNFRAALIEFQRAYETLPHHKLLYNLGQTSVELLEYGKAIEYLSGYLAGAGDDLAPARRAEVEQTLAELEARRAQVSVHVSEPDAQILVDDAPVGRSPLDGPVRVDAGRRRFVARKAGFAPAEQIVDVAASEYLSVDLLLEAAESAAPAPREEAGQVAGPRAFEPRAEPRSDDNDAALWSGLITGTLAAGTITMAVVTAVSQKEYSDERLTLTTDRKLSSLRSDAKDKALITDVLLATTGVSAIVTAVLLITGGEEQPAGASATPAGARVWAAPTLGGAALGGQF